MKTLNTKTQQRLNKLMNKMFTELNILDEQLKTDIELQLIDMLSKNSRTSNKVLTETIMKMLNDYIDSANLTETETKTLKHDVQQKFELVVFDDVIDADVIDDSDDIEISYLDRLRNDIAEKESRAKTLSQTELFDYIVDHMRFTRARSKMIKMIRDDGYAISQSRVFDMFKQIEIAYKKDLDAANAAKLSESERQRLDELQQREQEIREAEMKLQKIKEEIAKEKSQLI